MAHVAIDTLDATWPVPLSEWERVNHLLDAGVPWLEFVTTDGAEVRMSSMRIIAITRLTDAAIASHEARALTQRHE